MNVEKLQKVKGLKIREDNMVEVKTTFLLTLEDAVKMIEDMEREGIRRLGTYLAMLVKKRITSLILKEYFEKVEKGKRSI